jgi:ubiquinone/menaquinone biosynthesis C-methylase UbiE
VRTGARRLLQRAITLVYSALGSGAYDRIVASRTIPLLAGDIGAAIRAQGRRAAEVAGGRPVLDLPIGTGHFTLGWAKDHHGVVVGVDIAEGMIRRSASRVAEQGAANVVVLVADVHHLPFRAGTFGAIMCTNGLPVIPGLEGAVAELTRTLSPSGVMLACAISAPVEELLPRRLAPHLPALFRSERGLVQALEARGLQVTSARSSRLALLIEASPIDQS